MFCKYCQKSILPKEKMRFGKTGWSEILTYHQPTKFKTDPILLKAFADDKINLNQVLKLNLERIENMGKEDAAYQHFLLFPQCFQRFSFSAWLKVVIVTPLGNKPFENTVGKEKLLVTSNFSFTHSVFYPLRKLSALFIKFKIVVCTLFQIWPD